MKCMTLKQIEKVFRDAPRLKTLAQAIYDALPEEGTVPSTEDGVNQFSLEAGEALAICHHDGCPPHPLLHGPDIFTLLSRKQGTRPAQDAPRKALTVRETQDLITAACPSMVASSSLLKIAKHIHAALLTGKTHVTLEQLVEILHQEARGNLWCTTWNTGFLVHLARGLLRQLGQLVVPTVRPGQGVVLKSGSSRTTQVVPASAFLTGSDGCFTFLHVPTKADYVVTVEQVRPAQVLPYCSNCHAIALVACPFCFEEAVTSKALKHLSDCPIGELLRIIGDMMSLQRKDI